MDVEIMLTQQGCDSMYQAVDSCGQGLKKHHCTKTYENQLLKTDLAVEPLVWLPLVLYLVLSAFQFYHYRTKTFKSNVLKLLDKKLSKDLKERFKAEEYTTSLLEKEILKTSFLMDLLAGTHPKEIQNYQVEFEKSKEQLTPLKLLNQNIVDFLYQEKKKNIAEIMDLFYERIYQKQYNDKILAIVEQSLVHAQSNFKKNKSPIFFFNLILNFLIGSSCITLIYYGFHQEKVDFVTITLQASLLVTFCLLYKFFRKF